VTLNNPTIYLFFIFPIAGGKFYNLATITTKTTRKENPRIHGNQSFRKN
jgi:hypothetical protein